MRAERGGGYGAIGGAGAMAHTRRVARTEARGAQGGDGVGLRGGRVSRQARASVRFRVVTRHGAAGTDADQWPRGGLSGGTGR